MINAPCENFHKARVSPLPMGNFFPRWTNWLPLQIIIAVVFLVGGITAAVAYWFTPKYTKVGYEPTQPVAFSHKQHAGEIGLDCRYCHSFVEVSGQANVPTNQTCLNCHGPDKGQIKKDSEKLAIVRAADKNDSPIQWVKVHKAPDFVYFNHSVHLNRGISCVDCHGRIDKMEVVRHAEPHSMGWCLDCHRNPEKKLSSGAWIQRIESSRNFGVCSATPPGMKREA